MYRLGELHVFEAAEARFLYLVTGGAIFEVDRTASRLIDSLRNASASREQLIEVLEADGLTANAADELVEELLSARVIVPDDWKPEPVADPPANFPLQTLVLNLTNQCNLSCQYCYEYGADKVATPQGKA